MLLFNAFQIAVLYVAMPFIVNYLYHATFNAAFPLAVVIGIAYVVMFCFSVRLVYEKILDEFKGSK